MCQVRGVVLRRSDLHRAGPPVQPGVPEPQPITDHQAPERHQLQVGGTTQARFTLWTQTVLSLTDLTADDPPDKHVADIKFIQVKSSRQNSTTGVMTVCPLTATRGDNESMSDSTALH